MEDQLNAEEANDDSIPVEDLITDLVKVLHARRPESDSNDCLLEQCEKLVKLHANKSTTGQKIKKVQAKNS